MNFKEFFEEKNIKMLFQILYVSGLKFKTQIFFNHKFQIETSAKENVNINGLLKFIASNLEKHRLKMRILTYPEAHELQILKMKEAKFVFLFFKFLFD